MDISQTKHRQIIDAAVAEFRERGFAGASMDRISARAEVSKRTVYNHFESKDVLFRAILDIMATRANAAFDIAYDGSKPIRDELTKLGWAEGVLLTDADFVKLARMVVGETMRDPVLAAEMNEKMARLAVFREFLGDVSAAGALDIPDLDRATDQFLGLIKAQAFWPVIFSGEIVSRDQMSAIIQTTVDMFLKEYAPSGVTPVA
ncbi:MAG: TetR/AcrR family transcriptional regulator [Pseudomonadota bacterium]